MKVPVLLLKRFVFAATLLMISACSDDETLEMTNKLNADAGHDQQVIINDVITLDGTNSSNGNNRPFSFQWRLKLKPENSSAILTDITTATPRFTADLAGLYVLELTISSDQFSNSDQVSIVARPADNVPVAMELKENITTARTLHDIFEDPAKADYVVTNDIAVSAALTVAPGVVIEFDEDKSFHILPQGSLIAKGTTDKRIFFTGKVREKGYWKGILFQSNNVNNELDLAAVEFAGSNPLPDMGMIRANVALAGDAFSGAAVKISNSTLDQSGGYGLYVAGRSHLNDFSANYFSNNTGSAVYVPAAQLHRVDFFSHYTGNNGFNGVETGGVINADAEVAWPYFNDGSKYLVTQDLIIESGVRITEGATFEFADNVMVKVASSGHLDAAGSDFRHITFTAHQKSQDTFWRGIFFASASPSNKLHYAVISYAGSSQMPEINYKANVAVSPSAKVSVLNSTFEKGLGWGLVAEAGADVNADIATANFYDDFIDGYYKLPFPPETTTLTGQWMDSWSFHANRLAMYDNYYDAAAGVWFGGASSPWLMSGDSGFGLKINEDGSYLWTIAEHSPMTGCNSFSAEYITGNYEQKENQIVFEETYWRSKFVNSCAPDQNVDTNVQPGGMTLRFEINRMYNLFTGAAYWELKLINPDNSFFTYYKF
jgi:hypothetical protein